MSHETKRMRTDLFPFISETFEDVALRLFRYQAQHNPVYGTWLQHLGMDLARQEAVTSLIDVPFLPIETFKTQEVKTGTFEPGAIYTSSGTTGQTPSRHLVAHPEAYLKNAQACFEHFYGPVDQYAWLCLLPSYMEREGSSLIAMAEHFVKQSPVEESGFFLHGLDELRYRLETLELNGVPTIILGVTFALLDWAESLEKPLSLKSTIIMETGGMKGRRVEPVREEVHATLQAAFGLECIHSEYGMTELLSQAYSFGLGRYVPPPQLRILPRSPENPLDWAPLGSHAALNCVDLANAESCAFIATADLGKVFENGTFEVLGRMEGSDLRGCSLLTV